MLRESSWSRGTFKILMNPGPKLPFSGGGGELDTIIRTTLSQIAETARVGDVLPRSQQRV